MKDDEYGWMEAAFKVPCDLSDVQPSQEWITKLLLQNPDLTGWPFFVDLWTPKQPEWRPRIRNGVWECRVDKPSGDYPGIDFWRVDGRKGLFFAARALEDDTSPRVPDRGKLLEFSLAILRTAEVLAIAIRFANYLCAEKCDGDATVRATFKWTKLQGRYLSNWADRGRMLSRDYQCHSQSVSKGIDVPLQSTKDQLALYTGAVVADLFLAFDGWVCPSSVIEDLVGRLLDRRL